MAFTTESMEPTMIGTQKGPAEFDLPSREFIGYDIKARAPIQTEEKEEKTENVKQTATIEETVVPEESKKEEESLSLSPKVSALVRKEQAQRKREFELQQREKALAEKLAKAEKYETLQAKLANKDYSAVDDLGVKYDELANYEIERQKKETPEEIRLRKLEQESAQLKKALEEKEINEYKANQALWKSEIARVVAKSDDYLAIRELNAENIVLQHVNDSFDEDGIELTVEQAAQEIEAALRKRSEKFSSVFSKLKKPEIDKKEVLGPPKGSATITNNMTTTPVSSKPKPFHLMSESEQLAEAIRRVNEAKLKR